MRPEGLGKFIKIHLIGSRTHDHPAYRYHPIISVCYLPADPTHIFHAVCLCPLPGHNWHAGENKWIDRR
jgi:hypothetical protein